MHNHKPCQTEKKIWTKYIYMIFKYFYSNKSFSLFSFSKFYSKFVILNLEKYFF